MIGRNLVAEPVEQVNVSDGADAPSAQQPGAYSGASACSCSGNFKLMCSHLAKGLLSYLIRLIVLSLSVAYILACVDALRAYGVTPAAFPFTTLGQYQPLIDSENKTSFQAAFDNFFLLFNCAFPGGSRMGSGIGTLAASFWTLHILPNNCRAQRTVLGCLIGFIIGARGLLTVSSSANIVCGAGVLGAIFFTVYMISTACKREIPPLPIVNPEI